MSYRTMGPVVMVTNWAEGVISSFEKHPSEHSNNECVLLHVEADLLLLTGFSLSKSLGRCPIDLECLGGLGGATIGVSCTDSLLDRMRSAVSEGTSLWGSAV